MKKINIILSISVIMVLMMIGCDITGLATIKKQVTLGYCPTMSGLAEEIASKNNHILLQPFDYTAQALQSLNEGDIDMVLVGRLAKENEVNNPFEKQLRSGLTLVGREKRLIHISQLKDSRIHTAVDKNIANDYFKDTKNVLFYDSTKSAIARGMNDIVLIDWKNYTDNLELIIPVDDKGNKIESFRIPVLYSYTIRYIESLLAV